MGVYLCVKFEVSSIIPTGFRRGNLINCLTDITKTRFVCFDRANSMSGEKSGVQRCYRSDAPFSIYVNCRCHWLLCILNY